MLVVRRCLLTILLLMLVLAPRAAVAQVPGQVLPIADAREPLLLEGGWLFDGTGDEAVQNPGVVVRSGKILAIGAEAAQELDGVVQSINLSDEHYILPGMFDMHAHFAVDLFGEGRVDAREGLPLLFLANGVTSTFPAGEVNPEDMAELGRALARGERAGPRLHNSGPYFGTWRADWDTTMTAEEIYAEVDYWAEQGARSFKAKGASWSELKALVERAHRHGLTVTGHVDSGYGRSVNPETAIDLGIDRIEHFLGGDLLPEEEPAYASLPDVTPETPGFDEIVQKYIDRDVFYNVTLTAYGYYGDQDPEVFVDHADEQQYFTPYMQEILAEGIDRPHVERFERIYQIKHDKLLGFYERGGGHLITTGTDHPSWGQWLAPFGLHREIHAFTRAGIPEASALRAATVNGARALGLSDRLGTIEAGKWADLFVVRGNPLEDIRNTRNVELVMKAGELYDASQLLDAARGTIGPTGPGEEAEWRPRGE